MSALSCMYDKTAVVKRNNIAGYSDSGEEIHQSNDVATIPIIYSGIDCYIESDNSKFIIVGAGQTGIDYKLMICDLCDSSGTTYTIKKGDIIVADGASHTVTNVDTYTKKGAEHLEISMTAGV